MAPGRRVSGDLPGGRGHWGACFSGLALAVWQLSVPEETQRDLPMLCLPPRCFICPSRLAAEAVFPTRPLHAAPESPQHRVREGRSKGKKEEGGALLRPPLSLGASA